MKYVIVTIFGLTLGWIIGMMIIPSNEVKPFKCSHEYSYFKSDEVFIITQVPALNECEE